MAAVLAAVRGVCPEQAPRSPTGLERIVAVPRMPDTIMEKASRGSALKRPREITESYQSPLLKRSKTNEDPATTPTESTSTYDACPMPGVVDYFYEDLIPKALELSQAFPTLCRDVYVVRRWLGPAGCAIYWKMVMDDIDNASDGPNSSNPLAELIARSLAKLRVPQRETSSSKFRTLCETLKSYLGLGDDRRVVVFSKFRKLESLPEADLE